MIDNLNLILPLLNFDNDDSYYHLQVIRRKKENPELKSNNQVILDKVVTNEDYLRYNYSMLKDIANLTNARIYFNLNRKSFRTTALNMMSNLVECTKANMFKGVQRTFSSEAGRCNPPKGEKLWIIDCDKDDVEGDFSQYLDKVELKVNSLRPDGNKVITRIPTLNGTHIITKPFDLSQCDFKDTIHKNNPTVLYAKGN